MDVEKIVVDQIEAKRLYQQYRKDRTYSGPIDDEIRRTYRLLAQGKTIIQAIESIKRAGLDEKGLPKLALTVATAKFCHIKRTRRGALIMSPHRDFYNQRAHQFRFADETFAFGPETFPMNTWGNPAVRASDSEHQAALPIIPIHLRPKTALENYHVLWEAEWQLIPPRDPFLLRRIGKADLWLVVAAWELTDVERAALSTRITAS